MEDETREILKSALAGGRRSSANLAEVVRRRFSEIGGVELELPARESMRELPRFKP
jgi:plasmid stability protein